jgi:hypothetical protein
LGGVKSMLIVVVLQSKLFVSVKPFFISETAMETDLTAS